MKATREKEKEAMNTNTGQKQMLWIDGWCGWCGGLAWLAPLLMGLLGLSVDGIGIGNGGCSGALGGCNGVTQAFTVEFDNAQVVVDPGQDVTVFAIIKGGTSPFYFDWKWSNAYASGTGTGFELRPDFTFTPIGQSTESHYTVTVQVKDDEGRITWADKDVTVRALPAAVDPDPDPIVDPDPDPDPDPVGQPTTVAINPSPTRGTAPLTCVFAADTSHQVGVSITNYEWDLDGDGIYEAKSGYVVTKSATKNSSIVSYTFTDVGSHTVKVRVTDSIGGTAEDSTVIEVL